MQQSVQKIWCRGGKNTHQRNPNELDEYEAEARRDQDKYVHKGISGRKFVKSFRLSEYAEVNGADLTDGILTVSIEVVLPEKMRPQQISIGTGRQTNDNNSAQLLNESA